MAVTALQGSDLQMRQVLDWAGLVGQVPGLSIQQDSPAVNRLILRGENSGGAGATVAVAVDDVPFSYSASTADGSIYTPNFETYDMNRIEVLRGPQGTLYGAAAEGGIVRFITNAPDPMAFSAGGEVGVENVDQGQTVGDFKGFVNIPLDDTLAVRVVGYADQLPGYIGNWVNGGKDSNSGIKDGGRFSVLWEPTSDLTVRAGAFYQNLEFHGSSFVDLVGQGLTPANPPANRFSFPMGLSFGAQTPAISKNPSLESYVNIQYDFHWATLTSITSYGQMKDDAISQSETGYFIPGVPLSLQQYLSDFVYGQPVVVTDQTSSTLKKYNEELRLTSEPGAQMFGHDVEWQAGIFMTREVTSPFSGIFNVYAVSDLTTPLSPPFGTFNAPATYDEFSTFAQATYHFNPAWDLTVGGRFTTVSQKDQVFYGNGLFTTGLTGDLLLPETKSNQSSETWSVAPRWHLDEDNLIYARVATGFRPGGPELNIPSAPAGYPQSYQSDSTVNYELGWRSELFDKTVSVDLAAYYIDWSQIQIITTYVIGAAQYNVTGNAGSARTDGVEWNLNWAPLEGLNLNVVGSYTSAELTADAIPLGGAKGDHLAFVPPITNSVNVDYSWPWFGDYKGFAGGTWTYNGSVYVDFVAPSTAPLYGARTQLPGYNLVNLHGGIQDNRWTVEAYVKNLGNSHALTDYIPEGAYGPGGSVYGEAPIVQPRTIGLRVAFNY
jgi:iron complex outermembrane receptor protein